MQAIDCNVPNAMQCFSEFIEKLWVEVLTGMVDEPHSRVTSMDVEKAQVQDEMTRFGICRLLRFRLPMGTKGIPPRKFSVETDEDENGRYNFFVDMVLMHYLLHVN